MAIVESQNIHSEVKVVTEPKAQDAKNPDNKNTDTRALDTRERILNTAERLFMEHGYDATSMRNITSEAQVNLAAVNYHFGSKETLMREVFKRRLDWLNDERMRVLDEMEAASGGKPLKPSQIVDAMFGTMLRMGTDESLGGETFMRLLGRTLTDPSKFINTFLAQEYDHVIERFKEALYKSLPDVPKAEILWRFQFMLGATSYAIAGNEALHGVTDWRVEPAETNNRADLLLPRLMSFLLGGLRAPLPELDA